jgi:hypothetical protein
VVVVVYAIVLLLLCKKDPMNEEFLFQDPGTTASYYPFSLCLLVLPRATALRTLVVFGAEARWALKLFKKKGA